MKLTSTEHREPEVVEVDVAFAFAPNPDTLLLFEGVLKIAGRP